MLPQWYTVAYVKVIKRLNIGILYLYVQCTYICERKVWFISLNHILK